VIVTEPPAGIVWKLRCRTTPPVREPGAIDIDTNLLQEVIGRR
jgi:hypothetical protein